LDRKTFGKKLIEDYFESLQQRHQQPSERAAEISEVITALEVRGFALEEHRDVIRREFLGSVQRYLFGFYEDAIYHSCFAVELAFLHLLEENLDIQRKTQIHDKMNRPLNEENVKKNYAKAVIGSMTEDKMVYVSKQLAAEKILVEEFEKQKIRIRTSFDFGFRQIIRECKGKDLIDKTTYDLANKLNDIRDTHLHPQNFISALILQYKKFLNVPKLVQRTFYRFFPGSEVVVTMPDYSWAAKDA